MKKFKKQNVLFIKGNGTFHKSRIFQAEKVWRLEILQKKQGGIQKDTACKSNIAEKTKGEN